MLEEFESKLKSVLESLSANNLESALANTIITRKLTPENFYKLLKAFKQDVIKNRYNNFSEVMDYCSNSANPIGRILLELFNIRDEKAIHHSDKICTALQITNFIQDTSIDYKKGRIYYPLEDMEKFGITENLFEMKQINDNLKKLIEFSVERTQSLFNQGKPLLDFLTGSFRYEIAWTIAGGEEILKKIRGVDFDVFTKRPYLTKVDFLKVFFKAFIQR